MAKTPDLTVRLDESQKELLQEEAAKCGGKTSFVKQLFNNVQQIDDIIDAEDKSALEKVEYLIQRQRLHLTANEYDPHASNDAYELEKPLLREIARLEAQGREPKINPAHVNELPGRVDEYILVLTAVVRYETPFIEERAEVEKYVKDFKGDSDYFLSKKEQCIDAPGKILSRFYQYNGKHYTQSYSLNIVVQERFDDLLSNMQNSEDNIHLAETVIDEVIHPYEHIDAERLEPETCELIDESIEKACNILNKDNKPEWRDYKPAEPEFSPSL